MFPLAFKRNSYTQACIVGVQYIQKKHVSIKPHHVSLLSLFFQEMLFKVLKQGFGCQVYCKTLANVKYQQLKVICG